ncbi:phosphatase PAP2 family protein [Aminobacter sp. AP02]|uniref:phosphatase PAP2 family protein n=1 Tax=Aminobacter sp. AP02 TaxID=2135737 RepID=UPI000D6D5FC4|nr:phosphatase PAP2 family protein [Aminobacter sp. AP02]PWK69808.1 PAP2 superfamily protein [Aminobacter sp. AP02]
MAETYSTSTRVPSLVAGLGTQLAVKVAIVVAIVVIDFVWIAGTDFEFDIPSTLTVGAITGLLVAIAWFYRVKRPMKRFEVLCTETAVLLVFSAAAAVLSILMTSINLPLVDDQLTVIDGALGFDWLSYVGFVNQRPWLGTLSSLVYVTTLTQVALTVVALGLVGQVERVQRFVLAVMFGALICIVISAVLPAAGALATVRPPAEFMMLNNPIVDLEYKQAFFDLRNGLARFISLDEPRGLIAFPSYHCTLSVLIILAFARVRFWFWPVLAINVAVILSTPIDGGHHLADALGGIVVALVAWRLAKKLLEMCSAGRSASELTV